jgi:cyclophilin family peptidyl-prolyl cis-trans isomerase
MDVAGVGSIVLHLNAEAEPRVCTAIAALVRAGAYTGARLARAAHAISLSFAEERPRPRLEPRRVTHSHFARGSIGWSWSKTPADGNGELFVTLDRVEGLDAAYQEIGHVIGAGVALLDGLPIISSMRVVSGRAIA